MSQELPANFEVTLLHRPMQGSPALRVRGVDVRAGLQ
eukprot:CAMPEP_0170309924 /NCGR_PEP_ID=MMETSP0116_2-20130129/55436_1 /TAXON_ID=400756 /ORGANISM="Durinskia baltica, Strain CSIRO CS-38" /LENGTH=36 /DNA_ID= /DNA_START= /DNA_END= /DNA_ORIENTATION=